MEDVMSFQVPGRGEVSAALFRAEHISSHTYTFYKNTQIYTIRKCICMYLARLTNTKRRHNTQSQPPLEACSCYPSGLSV